MPTKRPRSRSNLKNNSTQKNKKRTRLTFPCYIGRLNDGGQSRNDWKTRPIMSLKPVFQNVYIANFAASQKMIKINKNTNYGIINVESNLKIKDKKGRVDNSICIEDSMDIDQKDFNDFIRKVAARIHSMSKEKEYVIVNCHAGINRASGSVLAWMIRYWGHSFNSAMTLLTKEKSTAAAEFKFKNRYQSFDPESKTYDSYSWPALYGDASAKLKIALARIYD